MLFSYQTNKIINGICEYCGIPAVSCEHYGKGQPKPLDEKDKLAVPGYRPTYKTMPVEPLSEVEKAKSMEDAKAKMAAMSSQAVLHQLAEPDETLDEI